MLITIDTSAALSDTDQAILGLLAGQPTSQPTSPAVEAEVTRRAAPKKRAAAKPEPEVEDEPTGPTLEDAVARAQELVGLKLTDAVRSAVKEIGAARVSELKGDQIAEFLEAVKDADSDVV